MTMHRMLFAKLDMSCICTQSESSQGLILTTLMSMLLLYPDKALQSHQANSVIRSWDLRIHNYSNLIFKKN